MTSTLVKDDEAVCCCGHPQAHHALHPKGGRRCTSSRWCTCRNYHSVDEHDAYKAQIGRRR